MQASAYKLGFTQEATGKTFAGKSYQWCNIILLRLICSGTKRKMIWRFGWTDSEEVHEVSLKHSFLTGKKV
jgi:hypothetical protein